MLQHYGDKSKKIQAGRLFFGMYYLPDVKCVAISIWYGHAVKAVKTGEEVLEVKG